jgi:hypothetical protein
VRVIRAVLVEVPQCADGGSQGVERGGPLRQRAKELLERRGEPPRSRDAGVELLQLGGGWQLAVQKQVRHLVERAVRGEVADPVAPVAQPALDGANRCLAGDHALETG